MDKISGMHIDEIMLSYGCHILQADVYYYFYIYIYIHIIYMDIHVGAEVSAKNKTYDLQASKVHVDILP